MSVRRGVARLGFLCALVGVILPLSAGPAVAAGETVRVSAPSRLDVGGSPGSVTVKVSQRRGECVTVSTRVGLQLPGLTPEMVRMQVAADGAWHPVSVTQGGDGFVVSARTAAPQPEHCARKSVSNRYRVFLLAGAPPGRLTVLGEAYTADGVLLGQDIETARMTGHTGPTPLPTPSAPPSPTPEEVEATEAAEEATEEPTAEVAAAVPTRAAAKESGGGFGIGTLVMLVGLGMVGIGIALLVMLARRGRDRPASAPSPTPGTVAGGSPPLDALPTAPIQRGASLYGGAARTAPTVGRSSHPTAPGRHARPGAGGTYGGPPAASAPSPGVDRTLLLPTTGSPRPRTPAPSPADGAGWPSPAPTGQEATQRIPTGPEPTARTGPADGTATGIESTIVLPPTPPREP